MEWTPQFNPAKPPAAGRKFRLEITLSGLDPECPVAANPEGEADSFVLGEISDFHDGDLLKEAVRPFLSLFRSMYWSDVEVTPIAPLILIQGSASRKVRIQITIRWSAPRRRACA